MYASGVTEGLAIAMDIIDKTLEEYPEYWKRIAEEMQFRLGNLTIAEVERRHEFTLSDDVRLELEGMRQEDAQEIGDGVFHVFSYPETMFACGSEQTKDHVMSLLSNYTSNMVGRIGFGIEEEEQGNGQKR